MTNNWTHPRVELLIITLNDHTGEVVRKYLVSCRKTESKSLIARFKSTGHQIRTNLRNSSSEISGFRWIKESKTNFPMKSIAEVKLDMGEITSMQQRDLPTVNSEERAEICIYATKFYQLKQSYIQTISNKAKHCYQFSNYLLDSSTCKFINTIRIFDLPWDSFTIFKPTIFFFLI